MTTEQLDYIGVFEIEGDEFHIQKSEGNKGGGYTIHFGGACNAGFFEEGYLEGEDHESLQDLIEVLYDELNLFSQYGIGATSRLVCNDD